MTCIVGLVDNGKVFIGGDSAGVGGMSLSRRKDPKVFINGEFVMGFTSSFRMGQLLAHSFKPPRRHVKDDLYGYMVTEFVDGVRSCLKTGGYASQTNGTEEGGFFLVGVEGRLFEIESDYQVAERLEPYSAVGCGADLALGALHVLNVLPIVPEEKVSEALKAAEHHSAGVCGPFTVLSIPAPSVDSHHSAV